MTTPTRRRPSVALGSIVIVAALTAGGCSAAGTGGSGSPTPEHTRSPVAVWNEFTGCARKHGVPNIPDPKVNPDGTADFPGFERESIPTSVQNQVLTACKSVLDALPAKARQQIEGGNGGQGSGPAEPPTADQLRALKQFAGCVRRNGLPDFPDPTADGEFDLDAHLASLSKPQMFQHVKGCQHLLGRSGAQPRMHAGPGH